MAGWLDLSDVTVMCLSNAFQLIMGDMYCVLLLELSCVLN